jgi:hypothetical protein
MNIRDLMATIDYLQEYDAPVVEEYTPIKPSVNPLVAAMRELQEEGILESINLNEGPDGDHQTGGSLGLPFPGTYEQEYGNFKSKGQRRMTTLTTEALDSSYPYRNSKRNPGNDFYFDTEDGQEYKVQFSSVWGDDVTVGFAAKGQGDEHKIGLTGTGNSRKIFGTVIKIVKDYIRKANPEIISFSANNNEPSRVRLYKMLASQANKELPNFDFAEAINDGGFTTYYLTQNDAKIPTSTKVKAKAGKALDAVFEETTTLTQLYGDDKPDRNDTIWDYGTMIWDTPYEIGIINPRTLDMYLCEQYNVEFIEDLFERMSEEQHEIVNNYIEDPNLSNKIIVLDNGHIVDGNHRAIAAALTKRPIKYVDIGEEEES